jgi:dihydrofolate reductase
MSRFKAVAAMSLDRVIGFQNRIPWHLPEDFRWFKQLTMGHTLVMGRKTFASIGRPLPGRQTYVLSRETLSIPGIVIIHSLAELDSLTVSGDIFICGGEQVYRLALLLCSDLFLTLVKQRVEGDAFFPPFEEEFVLESEIEDNSRFSIRHYIRKAR